MEKEKVLDASQEQLDRLQDAGIEVNETFKAEYLASEDDLGPYVPGVELPVGYKKCGGCGRVLKFYKFNRNKGSKTNTTGNCKACQKESAKKSYKKTKKKRNYKKYYEENKEVKQEAARRYYAKNKEAMDAKHREYVASKKGKAVMAKAHAKRRATIANNKGIPYTREMVIDRDMRGGKYPICSICGEPIYETGKDLHLDHVVPLLIGGFDCFTNIGCTHAKCNLEKKKDGSDVTAAQITTIKKLAEQYMDEHPELFEEDC